MTDRELLELAAKAAGYEYNGLWFDERTGLLVWEPPTNYESRHWNPLTDDGDALRLAVKLKLDTFRNGDCVGAIYRVPVHGTPGDYDTMMERVGDDPYAATRRAIVRAAAEIGRSMK